MILNISTPSFSRVLPHPSSSFKLSETYSNRNNASYPVFIFTKPLKFINLKASISESQNETSNSNNLLDQQLLLRVAATAKDADEALQLIADNSSTNGGVVSTSDCCSIISAALERNNPQLALSVFYSMRSTFHQVGESGPLVERWKWSRPNARVYTLLIQGLAASLRVSDALSVVKYICEVGVSPSEEVPFGKIVRCPTCRIAVAVAQPQQGIQIVSCAKCRYQYELVSGNIVNIQSEEIRLVSDIIYSMSSMLFDDLFLFNQYDMLIFNSLLSLPYPMNPVVAMESIIPFFPKYLPSPTHPPLFFFFFFLVLI